MRAAAFDLDLLLRRGVAPRTVRTAARKNVEAAIANATTVSFDQFSGQVLPYLPEPEQDAYDEALWDAAQLRVVGALEKLR